MRQTSETGQVAQTALARTIEPRSSLFGKKLTSFSTSRQAAASLHGVTVKSITIQAPSCSERCKRKVKGFRSRWVVRMVLGSGQDFSQRSAEVGNAVEDATETAVHKPLIEPGQLSWCFLLE